MSLPHVGTSFNCASLCSACGYCVFLQIERLWKPCIKQVCHSQSHLFPTAFVHLLSPVSVSVIIAIFQSFSLLLHLYGDLWSVALDVNIIVIWGSHEPCPCKLIDKCVYSDYSTNWLFPCLSPSPWASLFPVSKHSSFEIRLINNFTVVSKCSSKRKSCIFLTLNKKRDMIKLSEEGTLKAKMGQKLGLLHQPAKLWMQRTCSWRKLKVLLQWTHRW